MDDLRIKIGGLYVHGRIDDGFYFIGRDLMQNIVHKLELLTNSSSGLDVSINGSMIETLLNLTNISPENTEIIDSTDKIYHTYSASVFPDKFSHNMYSKYLQNTLNEVIIQKPVLYRPRSSDLRSKTISVSVAREIKTLHESVETSPDIFYRIRGKMVNFTEKLIRLEKQSHNRATSNPTTPIIILGIQSANRKFEYRQAIRKTYSKSNAISYIFLMDSSTTELEMEQSIHGDIHFLDVRCSTNDLICSEFGRHCNNRCNGEKFYHWLSYADRSYPRTVPFIAKIDDDIYICPSALEKFLRGQLAEHAGVSNSRLYYGWSPEAAYERWGDDARSNDSVKAHQYFKTDWHNKTYFVHKFDEMFTVLSRSVVEEIVAKPLCVKKNYPECNDRSHSLFKKKELGGTALAGWVRSLETPARVEIGNDEIISWQDEGDVQFDINSRFLCKEKIRVSHCTVQLQYSVFRCTVTVPVN